MISSLYQLQDQEFGDMPGVSVKSFEGKSFECIEQNGQFIIARLLSTDPSDFLYPEFCPGKILSFKDGKDGFSQE